ncbi:hypothetical protein BYT27DRAFT_7203862 [Phlegmacium glaucopus]|nr:hypothetical protein BYT27DRAFT_7203862 [Phlegmacium glaucopus]
MLGRPWTTLVLWFAAVLSVVGQLSPSNVAQCISGLNWTLNSMGQTPCYVAANLESICTPTTVDGIPNNTHYLGPTLAAADPCQCSSVTYSMISACGACQGRTFIDWTTYSTNCSTVTFMTFPKSIPSNVLVPTWAYLNLTQTNNDFNEVAARQNASAPISSSSSAPTASIVLPVSTSSSTASTSQSVRKSQPNAGAIAGGVVGGLVLIALNALAALWYLRRRRNMIQTDLTFDHQALVSGPAVQQITGSTGPSSFPSQSIYTSDNSTFPASPLTTSGVYTTLPGQRSLESVSLSVAQFGGASQNHGTAQAPRGAYSGRPEV